MTNNNQANKENIFYCPYCGCKKNIDELDYRTEVGGVRSSPEMPFGRPNMYKVNFDKYDIPICLSCLSIHEQASGKANIISMACFAIIFLILFFYAVKSNFNFDIMVPSFFAAFFCIVLRWGVKIIIVKNNGIKYHVSSSQFEMETIRIEEEAKDAMMNDLLKKFEEEERKRLEAFQARIEDWNKHHKKVAVDMGCGRKGYISKYIEHPEVETENLPVNNHVNKDFRDEDWTDDDSFYGGFV